MAIVLFDIDGTLLTFRGPSPGPGRTAMARASVDCFGADHTPGLVFAGGTDLALARAMASAAGISAEAVEAARGEVLAAYVEHLRREVELRPYVPLGEVASTMEWLETAGHVVGLATGNLREGAGTKLRSAGILCHFALDRGGYGGDHEARADLVAAAIAACGGGATVVVGDTAADVRAARDNGAKVVGITSVSRDPLEDADARAPDCGPSLRAALATLLC